MVTKAEAKKTGVELTEENAQDYLRCGGLGCPFCQSDQIEGGSVEVEAGSAGQDMQCGKCCKRWRDNYRLASISTYSGDYFELETLSK